MKNKQFQCIFLFIACLNQAWSEVIGPIELSDVKPNELEAYAQITPELINESSGIVKSRQYDNVYWTINDSGGEPALYPITFDGKGVKTKWAEKKDRPYEGIAVPDTVNVDWEDIALDDNGYLIIGAFGNNGNARKDLAVYYVAEPNPFEIWKTVSLKKVPFHYPEQKAFPPHKSEKNYDCEALFTKGNVLYLLTKHRGNHRTRLYRFDSMEPFVSNPLTLVDEFDLGKSSVTAADLSADGQRLAVLTYKAVWVFEQSDGTDRFLRGAVHWLPIKARQAEAICWNGSEELLITNEQRDLFTVSLQSFEKVK